MLSRTSRALSFDLKSENFYSLANYCRPRASWYTLVRGRFESSPSGATIYNIGDPENVVQALMSVGAGFWEGRAPNFRNLYTQRTPLVHADVFTWWIIDRVQIVPTDEQSFHKTLRTQYRPSGLFSLSKRGMCGFCRKV